MRTKYKVAFIILIVASLAVIFSAVALKARSKKSGSPSTTTTPTSSATAGGKDDKSSSTPSATKTVQEAHSSSKTYKNTDYGFEVTFPDSFEGYEVKKAEISGEGMVARYTVLIPTSDTKYSNLVDGKASPMEFFVYNKTFWEGSNRPGVRSSEIIKSDKYVYTYSTWESSPEDKKTLTDKDLVKVIETFKLNN